MHNISTDITFAMHYKWQNIFRLWYGLCPLAHLFLVPPFASSTSSSCTLCCPSLVFALCFHLLFRLFLSQSSRCQEESFRWLKYKHRSRSPTEVKWKMNRIMEPFQCAANWKQNEENQPKIYLRFDYSGFARKITLSTPNKIKSNQNGGDGKQRISTDSLQTGKLYASFCGELSLMNFPQRAQTIDECGAFSVEQSKHIIQNTIFNRQRYEWYWKLKTISISINVISRLSNVHKIHVFCNRIAL